MKPLAKDEKIVDQIMAEEEAIIETAKFREKDITRMIEFLCDYYDVSRERLSEFLIFAEYMKVIRIGNFKTEENDLNAQKNEKKAEESTEESSSDKN